MVNPNVLVEYQTIYYRILGEEISIPPSSFSTLTDLVDGFVAVCEKRDVVECSIRV
jgi:hypothetical protein